MARVTLSTSMACGQQRNMELLGIRDPTIMAHRLLRRTRYEGAAVIIQVSEGSGPVQVPTHPLLAATPSGRAPQYRLSAQMVYFSLHFTRHGCA